MIRGRANRKHIPTSRIRLFAVAKNDLEPAFRGSLKDLHKSCQLSRLPEVFLPFFAPAMPAFTSRSDSSPAPGSPGSFSVREN